MNKNIDLNKSMHKPALIRNFPGIYSFLILFPFHFQMTLNRNESPECARFFFSFPTQSCSTNPDILSCNIFVQLKLSNEYGYRTGDGCFLSSSFCWRINERIAGKIYIYYIYIYVDAIETLSDNHITFTRDVYKMFGSFSHHLMDFLELSLSLIPNVFAIHQVC